MQDPALRLGCVRMGRLAQTITDKSVGAYKAGSFSERARGRRWERFAAIFPELADMHILDVGGDARSWRLSGLRPAHVTLLNIAPQTVEEDWMTALVGD